MNARYEQREKKVVRAEKYTGDVQDFDEFLEQFRGTKPCLGTHHANGAVRLWVEKSDAYVLLEIGDYAVIESDGVGVYPFKGTMFEEQYGKLPPQPPEWAASMSPQDKLDALKAMGFIAMWEQHQPDCGHQWDHGIRCNCVPPGTSWRAPTDVVEHMHETWDELRAKSTARTQQ